MYVKKHAQSYWQKIKRDGRAPEINQKNRKNTKKHYDENKEQILAEARNYRNNNYVKCALIRIKSRCKRLDIPFDISPEDITMPTHCPVFGLELMMGEGKGANDASPSFDRIEPERGYVKGNVIVVSNKANRMKNSGTVADMKRLVEYYEHL